ncbi:MAG: chorismate lyase [Gallionella sp.]|nr:chorismate lyase [Gallionella sp.]
MPFSLSPDSPPQAGERDEGSLRESRINDTFWNAAAWGANAELMPWLRDHGSLTQRIQQRCGRFTVQKVRSGLARIAQDESFLLGIASRQLAWSREVFLCADDQPVVFAHSACAAKELRRVWSQVRHLGNKPLGAVLFSHPLISREPLHYQALHAHHPLYRRAAAVLSCPPDRLWARRSLFYLHGAPLLVTEVFLPEILKCRIKDRGVGIELKSLLNPES